MKEISAALIVLSGSAMLIAYSNSTGSRNPDHLFWIGLLTCFGGLAGWAYTLMEKK